MGKTYTGHLVSINLQLYQLSVENFVIKYKHPVLATSIHSYFNVLLFY